MNRVEAVVTSPAVKRYTRVVRVRGGEFAVEVWRAERVLSIPRGGRWHRMSGTYMSVPGAVEAAQTYLKFGDLKGGA